MSRCPFHRLLSLSSCPTCVLFAQNLCNIKNCPFVLHARKGHRLQAKVVWSKVVLPCTKNYLGFKLGDEESVAVFAGNCHMDKIILLTYHKLPLITETHAQNIHVKMNAHLPDDMPLSISLLLVVTQYMFWLSLFIQMTKNFPAGRNVSTAY